MAQSDLVSTLKAIVESNPGPDKLELALRVIEKACPTSKEKEGKIYVKVHVQS